MNNTTAFILSFILLSVVSGLIVFFVRKNAEHMSGDNLELYISSTDKNNYGQIYLINFVDDIGNNYALLSGVKGKGLPEFMLHDKVMLTRDIVSYKAAMNDSTKTLTKDNLHSPSWRDFPLEPKVEMSLTDGDGNVYFLISTKDGRSADDPKGSAVQFFGDNMHVFMDFLP